MILALAARLGSSIVSGLVPVVNAEVLLVAATVSGVVGEPWLVATVVTLGQMIAKAGLYFAARWAPHLLPERARAALQRGTAYVEQYPNAVFTLVGGSAVVGLPPFYAVTLASGALSVPFVPYLLLGTVGRALRFGALAWATVVFGDVALDFLS